MYRVWIEDVLGLKKDGDHLSVEPVIPGAWDGFNAHLRHGEALYEIEVMNPDHLQSGVAWIELDGKRLEEPVIVLDPEPVKHVVRVRMGVQNG
jgi:cellobiose phosphorylase